MTFSFATEIRKFNGMYRMLVNPRPTLDIGQDLATRLVNFKSILGKELDEVDDIIAKVHNWNSNGQLVTKEEVEAHNLEVLTDIADLLGDIQVYCASEMAKFGLPLDETLSIIMESNFSKMGADGNPIYDAQGKLQKGPNYWKPEPRISAMIQEKQVENAEVQDTAN